MRKARKGFTLVELLIVIAVIGTLSSTMMVATKGASVKAKVASIVANVEACRKAADMYCDAHDGADSFFDDKTADDVIGEYIGTWSDYKRDAAEKTISYEGDTATGRDNWAIIIDVTNDPDKDAIISSLSNVKGYGKYGATESVVNTGKFKVNLIKGTVTSETVAP